VIEDETRKVAQVIELEEDAYPRIKQAVNTDIQAFIDRLHKDPGLLKSDNIFKKWLPEPDKDLIKETYILMMKASLLGMAHTSHPATDFADIPIVSIKESMDALTYEEAINWAKGRVTMTRKQFYALSASMRKRAFTVGRLTQLDLIEKAKSLYLAQLEGEAASMEAFVASIKANVDAVGLPRYYENVYRTNIQTDYNAGRAMEMERNKPYALQFIGIEDGRQTDICRVRSGVVLPYDDPWWDDNWPPLHYNCRSTVRAIYQEEADILGISMDEKPPESASSDDSSPMKGFGRNPVRASKEWSPSPAQKERIESAGIHGELDLLK
jgi:SPP1 gp7 family putative phage head morphogenesis protein